MTTAAEARNGNDGRDERIAAIARDYLDAGLTVREILNRHGLSSGRFYELVRNEGWALRKARRRIQFRENFRFFGAPLGLFIYIDRQMQPGQWADVGMFVQTIMLLAREHGLHTCPQEAWAMYHKTVARHLRPPPELMLFCGIAMGYMEMEHPLNALSTERAPLEEFCTFLGT